MTHLNRALIALTLAASARAQTTRHVDLQFAAVVNHEPFACGHTYPGVGLKATTITPQDFRFFVSAVELLKPDGTAVKLTLDQDAIWQYHDLALLDFEDGTGACRNGNAGLHTKISGTVPDATYTGVRFTLGVPPELDHLDAASAPAPLNTTAMFWSWRNGYKFLKLEVSPVLAPAPVAADATTPAPAPARLAGFPMHLGSVGCVSTSPTIGPPAECTQPNRVAVTFDHFDTTHDVVTADVAAMFANTDFAPADKKLGGCMSGPGNAHCEGVMQALGLPYGEIKPTVQSFFRQATGAPSVATITATPSTPTKVE
jgi:uncharacterized repeat protein (TIGR04052 family)